MLRRLILIVLVLCLVGATVGGVFVTWGYFYITRDLPRLETVEDFTPPLVSQVFASDGQLVGEFYTERRYPAKIDQIPPLVRNAFLAAEDANFYHHAGIDIFSILRALKENLLVGQARQGGSTITQQVVKNLLLTPEKKITRKIKEAILSYRLEKRLSKNDILEIYLNQIFFGNSAYGVRAAAKLYFHKELKDVSIAEAAILAGLPKAPSKFSPILNAERARRRQQYVLHQMAKAGFITEEQATQARQERVRVYPATSQNLFQAPYYVGEVRRILSERWKDLNPDNDGLQIYTALDVKADRLATKALRVGLREVDKRRGWRGPLASGVSEAKYRSEYGSARAADRDVGEPYPALVLEAPVRGAPVRVLVGDEATVLTLKDSTWANRKRDVSSDSVSTISLERELRVGDVIEVSLQPRVPPSAANQPDAPELTARLDQSPEIEGAIVLLDPYSGEVLVTVGGYDYSRSVFNRATQSLRQPGSAFKPIVYLTAVDAFNYTPATIVYDTPRTFKVGDQTWTPANFDEKFLGPITLRNALEKSRNLVSADIVSRIGVDPIIQYAKKMGIESKLGRNLSIALGSSEVTLLELARAYGVFAAKGVLADSVIITKIIDRKGNVVFDYQNDRLTHARQVIPETSAFLMASLMKGVVESGTATVVKAINRPVAGKTGTSNEEMDTWFIGYTPQWVAGIWVGFDLKKRIGSNETGGRVAAPIWLNFMREFLNQQDQKNYAKLADETKSEAERLGIAYVPPDPLEPQDFSPPEGVESYMIYKPSGMLAEGPGPGIIKEYFKKGTEPNKSPAEEQTQSSYLESPDL